MGFLDSRLRTALILAGIVGCTGARRPAASTPNIAAAVPNLYEDQRQVDEYVSSGRYDGDVVKVAVAARAWLEERAKTAVKPAIVLDIDETSLSNWPAYRI